MTDTTEDRFLGGRVVVHQPLRGFRSGLDAVLLAAAVPAEERAEVLELGCGAGVASICLAARVEECKITGFDSVSSLVALANANARANGMESRLTFFVGDALSQPGELRREYDHVFCNPPFHFTSGERSSDDHRAIALGDEGRLGEWIRGAFRRVRSQGTLTLIVRADRLNEAMAELPGRGLSIFPLWPREDQPAKRVILQARKNARTPLALLPGLVLHESDGRYTSAAEEILRGAGSLAVASWPL